MYQAWKRARLARDNEKSELLHNLNRLQSIGRVNPGEYGLLKANITRGEFEVVKKFIKQRSLPEEKRVSNNDEKGEAEGPNTPVANESDGGDERTAGGDSVRWNNYAKSYKARAVADERERRAAEEAAEEERRAAEEERRAAEEAAEEERRALHQQWRDSLTKRGQGAGEEWISATEEAEQELLAGEMEPIANGKQGGRQGSANNQRFRKLTERLGSLISSGQ
jgi:hypothetical protein